MSVAARPPLGSHGVSPNPNDQDTVPTVMVHGRGPGRRAGHTATAVGRKIYIFGGSCGSDYLNDFYVLDTDPPQHATVLEPCSLQLIQRRLKHFYNNDEFSDVTFLVQGQQIHGHKMILSSVSDCFRAMFMAGFREQDSMEIEIKDCSYGAFLALMEYIYTGKIPRIEQQRLHALQLQQQQHPSNNGNESDSQSAAINPNEMDASSNYSMQSMQRYGADIDQIVEILELADRFMVDHLKQICETVLQPMVCAETLDFLLHVSSKTNALQLQSICRHFSRNQQDNAASMNASSNSQE